MVICIKLIFPINLCSVWDPPFITAFVRIALQNTLAFGRKKMEGCSMDCRVRGDIAASFGLRCYGVKWKTPRPTADNQ
ncbi:MAG: hypothetical protein C7B43_18595 [Sulfobacillus benefaciens]|uniref:Uncharacterized protein n=1 Tax=Sulfobacillus benefaciens TaxID=453960 RepID=A0A2T2WQW5_9FIRM|nr:MAG: hypothetical protein C7B43_18595 [Sulfobacillus benefaciens]